MSEDDNKKSAVGAVYYSVDKLSAGGKALINVVSNAGNRVYTDLSPAISAWVESKAEITEAKKEIEIQRLRNASMKVVAKAARADENIRKTVTLAAESIPENVPKENIKEPDVDWMTSWEEYAGRISEEEVQSLWAGILAEKVQKTGSFPLRTLSIVRDMDKDAAEKFINFCHFVTDKLGYWGSIQALIYDAVEARAIYDNQGVRFDLLNEMISLGLLVKSSYLNHSEFSEILFSYRGEHVIVNRKHNEALKKYEVKLGDICLTSAGKELFSLIRKTHEVKNIAFWQYLLKKWENEGLQPRKVSIEEANAVLASLGQPPLE